MVSDVSLLAAVPCPHTIMQGRPIQTRPSIVYRLAFKLESTLTRPPSRLVQVADLVPWRAFC